MTESLRSRKTGVAAVMRIIKICKPDGNYELENKWFNLLLWGSVIQNLMSAKNKPFKLWFFYPPNFADSVALGSIKYRPAPTAPFESGLEHFNVTFLLIMSHIAICMTSSKVESR